jgi:hypothetical protein
MTNLGHHVVKHCRIEKARRYIERVHIRRFDIVTSVILRIKKEYSIIQIGKVFLSYLYRKLMFLVVRYLTFFSLLISIVKARRA